MEQFDLFMRIGPELAVKFIVAALCGGAIGMEREVTGKPAGLRTSILISIGSMLFTVMSVHLAALSNGDPTRIAAQIVSGIGFLGAGVILHRDGGVKGMTTAAMIWLMAALGVMIGAGYLLSAMAISLATVVTILLLGRVEVWVHRRHGRYYRYLIRNDEASRQLVTALIESFEEDINAFELRPDEDSESLLLSFSYIGANLGRRDLLNDLGRIPGTRRYRSDEEDISGNAMKN
jgi:putative Mg2+ transporter-C (MgtC) family protein